MSKKWIWLPDWASDLSLWEDDLTDADASADHVFVPYETMAANLGNVYAIDGMPKAETVVGWGLGALLLMCAQSKRPKLQKWILLSPFADFCDEDGPWNSENILFKAREMHGSKNVALDAFKDQFGEEFSDWPDEWLEAAQKMDPDSLAEGLRFMVQNRIDRVIENGDDIQVLYGRMDQDVTPAMTLKLKEFLPKATFKERPKSGHWPPMMLF
ncbi:hypothetical protein SAMN05720472_1076 [Fibrobacter sp. UWR3]|jgi:pimeloyl-ACP methyl ester carboxylesterase|uniref:alpha/beta fold hydrolase n=1 Tax=Fibrobacter sp. UWR3 TaxID=1896217 RepID=UPI000923D88F|nr:alpha/beta hydrolase [Fibrobacter sp. UWR3]SHM35117.1 hypothetical protein SAMN05720472_1076 [Fibrobacter sp. UWR3]